MNAIAVQAEVIAQGSMAIDVARDIAADLYLEWVTFIDASKKTVETYFRAVKQFFVYLSEHGITQPQRRTVLDYREWLLQQGRKATTIQNYIIALRQFFTWTEATGKYPNIAAKVKGAKIDREHKKDCMTPAQIGQVLGCIDRTSIAGLRDYAIFVLMTTGGLRDIEVVRADIADIRTAGGSPALYVQGKGRDEKTEFVKLSPAAEQAIHAYLKARGSYSETEPLFVSISRNNNGGRLTTRAISGIIKSALRAAGFNSGRLTAHSLRHTAVTLSLLAGKDITEVQQFARHANITTTMIYSHALDKAQNTCSTAVDTMIFGSYKKEA